jgi:hypothetical protein
MREVTDEPLMSESEKTTWLAMADREGEYGWLPEPEPEPEWSPAREVGGAGGKADALSLSHQRNSDRGVVHLTTEENNTVAHCICS